MRNGVCSQQPPLAPLTNGNGGGAWPTPAAQTDSRTATASPEALARGLAGTLTDAMGGNRTAVTSLAVQSKMWATPTSHDAKGPGFDDTNLANIVGRLAETTTTDGENGSPKADLNPFFVAMLLGLPADWGIHSTSSEMVSSHNAQLRHGANSFGAGGGHYEP